MKKLLFVFVVVILSLSSCLTNYNGGEVDRKERDELGSDPRVHIDTSVYKRTYVAFNTGKDHIYVYDRNGDLIWTSGYCNNGDVHMSFLMVLFLIFLGMGIGHWMTD